MSAMAMTVFLVGFVILDTRCSSNDTKRFQWDVCSVMNWRDERVRSNERCVPVDLGVKCKCELKSNASYVNESRSTVPHHESQQKDRRVFVPRTESPHIYNMVLVLLCRLMHNKSHFTLDFLWSLQLHLFGARVI